MGRGEGGLFQRVLRGIDTVDVLNLLPDGLHYSSFLEGGKLLLGIHRP